MTFIYRWYEKIRSVLDSTQLDNGAATAAAVAPPRTASSTPTTSPTPIPAGPLPGSPQLTLRSSAPSPDTREVGIITYTVFLNILFVYILFKHFSVECEAARRP